MTLTLFFVLFAIAPVLIWISVRTPRDPWHRTSR